MQVLCRSPINLYFPPSLDILNQAVQGEQGIRSLLLQENLSPLLENASAKDLAASSASFSVL